MKPSHDLCSLDYLAGTLATAYKGVITALVVKDFCMTAEGASTLFTGTVLSMPAGDYEARLIRSGVELSRAPLKGGYFELKAESGRVRNARELQIDIVRSGRHIGTFLLKREKSGGAYSSAVELSDELRGMDLKRLIAPLREKVGLLQKAEEVVSAIVSAKKDWEAVSEKINGFSIDLFWSVRDAFYGSFPLLVHFSRLAAERSDNARTGKPTSNLLDSMELLLAHEDDPIKLRTVVDVWLREVNASKIDFTPFVRRTIPVLGAIHEKFPDTELGPVLRGVLSALREKTVHTMLLKEESLRSLRDFLQGDDFVLLNTYAVEGRQVFLRRLSEAERFLEGGEYQRVLAVLGGLNMDVLDDEKMVSAFFEVVSRSLRGDSVRPFTNAVGGLFPLLPGLSHKALESVDRDLPRIIKQLIGINGVDACRSLFDQAHQAGPAFTEKLLLSQGVARSVLESGSGELIRYYCSLLTQLVIPSAKVSGLSTDTWAELVDPLHLERLSKFMDILQLGGEQLRDALIHVTANLYVSGVFIPDDKLFQRKVSEYLNSGALSAHPLENYLLLKKLPVYFNEVGAVSMIRDYSTELDSWGNDPALYFLRKQVHVNASNYNIPLIEKIIGSWVHNDPSFLRDALPREVYDTLTPALWEQYSSVIKPFFESLGVLDSVGLRLEKLLSAPEETMRNPPRAGSDEIRAKVMLLCKLYRELVKKYSFAAGDFDRTNPYAALAAMAAQVTALNRKVLSAEKTPAQEQLYFKRHIAFGIPSVLGSYHERKFDALGEMLRCEGKIGVMLEDVISGIEAKDSSIAPKKTAQWIAALSAAYELLVLRGFRNAQIDELIVILQRRTLRLSQVADLLKMWQKELTWIVEGFNRTFLGPLANVLKLYPRDALPATLMNLDPKGRDFEHKAADMLLRDMLNDLPGLVESDRLIERVLGAITLRREQGFDDELNADAPAEDRKFFALHDLPDETAMRLAPLLGGKAKNLAYLGNRGFLVPAGCVFSSLHTDHYRSYTGGPEFLSVLKQAVRGMEEKTGTVYGGNEKPLFLSVRSGSYASMPGILSSLLYCGMNEQTIGAFIQNTGDARLAWDAYRRFLEHYGTVVLGLEPGLFESIRDDFRKNQGTKDSAFGPDQLKKITGLYHEELARQGLRIPGDVYEQLRRSIQAVYASWFSERAKQFRKATTLSGQWGTAVVLMQMISGNAEGSGTSVFFTRNPFTHEQAVYGETRENAAGDDLVSGKQSNRPLAKPQVRGNVKSLEELDPELFAQHHDLARRIEDAMGLPQEVEVTYTKGRDGTRALFVLQTRRMEFGGDFSGTFDEICRMESRIIGRGAGAHGGALSGAASFGSSPAQVEQLQKRTGMPVILLRKTANTDDVSLMPLIRGMITTSGGVTSHAAVLAQKFDVTAVVACSALSFETDAQGEPYARMGDLVVREGDLLSMDGATGLVFSGACLSNGNKKIATKSPRH